MASAHGAKFMQQVLRMFDVKSRPATNSKEPLFATRNKDTASVWFCGPREPVAGKNDEGEGKEVGKESRDKNIPEVQRSWPLVEGPADLSL